MKNLFTNSLTILVSVVAALLVSEYTVRLLHQEPQGRVIPDPVLGERTVIGDGWDTNGFFNESIPERTNVLAIGDSLTQGYGVKHEETWPTVFGMLASTSVYQLGLPGSGPLDYLYRLNVYGVPLKPKLVIVMFYPGNDLYDSYRLAYHNDFFKLMKDPSFAPDEKPVADAELRTEVLAGAPRESLSYKIFQARLYMRYHSQLFALIGDATHSLRVGVNLADTDEENLDQVKALSEKNPDIAFVYDKYPEIATILSPSYRFDAVDLAYPNSKEGWRLTRLAFQEMASTTHAMGAEFVIVEVPTKEQAYLKFMRSDEGKIPEAFTQYEKKEDVLLSAFNKFCNEEQIHCVTLLPHLVQGLQGKKTMYKPVLDGHPYPWGYSEFAAGIYEYIKAKRLLPGGQ